MTYEVGQKILVEATVRNPEIDEDGDIRVLVGDYEYIHAPAAATRPIDPEPQTIAFSEVQVGDFVRVINVGSDGVGATYSGIVKDRQPRTFVIDKVTRVMEDSRVTIELISRPEPEPEPIKVGDTVTVEQVKTLPVGSVVTKDDSWFDIKDRMVTGTGLYNPQDVKVTVWHVYAGDTFTVKYIAG